MPTTYLALIGDRAGRPEVHLVAENAEASLCGLPRAGLSSGGFIDAATVCRDCMEWAAKRWTGTLQAPPVP